MANTTLTVALDTDVDQKLTALMAGVDVGAKGCSIKAFTATAGTGTYPVAGLTLDLSGLFKTKVFAVVCSPLYDPAVTTGDLSFPTVYIPSAGNAPGTGKLHIYTSNGAASAGLLIAPDATATITGYVVTGFAIGY